MVAMGMEGYCKHAKDIMETTKIIADGVRSIAGLRLLGKAEAMIVCFEGAELDGKRIDIYGMGDAMTKKGWNLNTVYRTTSIIAEFSKK